METYYVHFRSGQIFYRRAVPHGYPFTMEHLPDRTFFTHRIPWKSSVWTVSETNTGSRMGGEHRRQKLATAAAKQKLKTVSLTTFKSIEARALRHTGMPLAEMPIWRNNEI